MATHSSILAWEISWTEEPGGLQSTGSQKVPKSHKNTTEQLTTLMSLRYRLYFLDSLSAQ